MIPEELNGGLGQGTYKADVDESSPAPSGGTYNLELTENELAVLQVIMNRIGGDPGGARGYASVLRERLLNINPKPKCDKRLEIGKGYNDSIYFV